MEGGENMPLIMQRKQRVQKANKGLMVIKVSEEVYDKLQEVADETGRSIRNVADKMIRYAYDEIQYSADEE